MIEYIASIRFFFRRKGRGFVQPFFLFEMTTPPADGYVSKTMEPSDKVTNVRVKVQGMANVFRQPLFHHLTTIKALTVKA